MKRRTARCRPGAWWSSTAPVPVGVCPLLREAPVRHVQAIAAGLPYAIFWTAIIGARAAFSYGSVHWFTAPLVSWGVAHQVSVAALTDGLIFDVIDLLGAYARPLPIAVLCELLGIPAADRVWIAVTMAAYDECAEHQRVERELAAYFTELIAVRRAEPGDDGGSSRC